MSKAILDDVDDAESAPPASVQPTTKPKKTQSKTSTTTPSSTPSAKKPSPSKKASMKPVSKPAVVSSSKSSKPSSSSKSSGSKAGSTSTSKDATSTKKRMTPEQPSKLSNSTKKARSPKLPAKQEPSVDTEDEEEEDGVDSFPRIAGTRLKPEWWEVIEAVLSPSPSTASSSSSSAGSSSSSDQHAPISSTAASSASHSSGSAPASNSRLAARFGVDRGDELSETTTHLVIGEQKRTLKVLQALARGLWIVGYEWVLQSVSRERWLDEEKFEAVFWFPGSRLSRQTHEEKRPLLMTGKKFFINGQNTVPSPDDLKQLIVDCGGEVVPAFRTCTICLSSSTATRPRRNTNNTPILRCEWFLDSLQDYTLKDFEPYLYNTIN